MIVHHLVGDAVSWQVLLGDLLDAYDGIRSGRPATLARTTSFRDYARRVASYAATAAAQAELPFWLSLEWPEVAPLPTDEEVGDFGHEGRTRILVEEVGERETRTLMERAASAGVHHLLLTALGHAVSPLTGTRAVLVDTYHHGRTPPIDGVDLARTVGWIATLAPTVVVVHETATETLTHLRARLAQAGHGGFGFGVLRYAAPADVRERLRALPRPDLYFNYRGHAARFGPDELDTAPEHPGPWRSPAAKRPYALELTADLVDGRLLLRWHYSDELYRETPIRELSRSVVEALFGLADALAARGR